jgi:hypothetical protein
MNDEKLFETWPPAWCVARLACDEPSDDPPCTAVYTAVELRTGVFAGEETPVLNQSEVSQCSRIAGGVDGIAWYKDVLE